MDIEWTNLTSAFENLGKGEGGWWIVSPFLTVLPPIAELSDPKILIRGEIADFLEGSSSMRVVQDLLTNGVEVRTLSNLNAKIYLREGSRNSFACIGSANLTNGGLKNNIEVMSTPIKVKEDFVKQLRQLWDSARPISLQEIAYIASATRFAKPWAKDAQELESLRDVGGRLISAPDLVADSFARINEMFTSLEPSSEAVLTGFRELDSMTGGLEPGSLTIIAGRPSMGKSSLALTIVGHCLLKQTIPVLFFSLEMTALQVTTRLKCSEARVDMSRVRNGRLSDRDFQRLADTAGRLAEAPLFIDETSDLPLGELATQARGCFGIGSPVSPRGEVGTGKALGYKVTTGEIDEGFARGR